MYNPAVTPSFLANVAACVPNGRGLVHAGIVLYPLPVRGAWALATVGDTITIAVAAELNGSTANADGSYTITATGASRVLNVNNGACEPSGPPPP